MTDVSNLLHCCQQPGRIYQHQSVEATPYHGDHVTWYLKEDQINRQRQPQPLFLHHPIGHSHTNECADHAAGLRSIKSYLYFSVVVVLVFIIVFVKMVKEKHFD